MLHTNIVFSQTQAKNVVLDSIQYKKYKPINYASLPPQIKIIMKNTLKCGEVNAEANQKNDYKSNYDQGFQIELNDDQSPEYTFCCTAPSHGPCTGNIFSFINGKWTVILTGIYVFDSDNGMDVIQIYKAKHSGFHDIKINDKYYFFSNGKYILFKKN